MEWIQSDYRGIKRVFDAGIGGVVPKERWIERPGEQGNSIAWVLWHMARTEDVTIHAISRARPQILVRDNWPDRIGVDELRQGTGFTDEEVAGFSAVNVDAVEAYWHAVRAETEAWLTALKPEELDKETLVENATAVKDAAGIPDGLIRFWGGRPIGFLLRFSVLWHQMQHIGEMQSIRGRMGYAWV